MTLHGLIQRDIKKVDPATPLLGVAQLMRQHKVGSVLIATGTGTHYTGIITETDLVRKGIAQNLPFHTTACFLIGSPIIAIEIEKAVNDANHMMHFNGVRHLAVSEKGQIVGLLSVRDLVRYFLEETDGALAAMADVFEPLTVLIHRDLQTTDEATSVKDAAQQMASKKVGSLIVTTQGKPVGIVTETDLARKAIGHALPPETLPVKAIMNAPIIDIDIKASLREANTLMATKGVRHLVVTEAGKIVGILSIRDLIGMISIRDLPRFFSTQTA